MKNGRIEAIWIKRFKRGPMDAVTEAEMVNRRGLVGNADQGGRRQVTIIDAAVWEQVMKQLNANLDPSLRRANLMVRGIDLAQSRKKILQLGACRVRIFNETKPCERMDEALLGLQKALYDDWRGGAFGEVMTGGIVRVGDVARWE